MMEYAKKNDIHGILELDKHINEEILLKKIQAKEVYVIRKDRIIIGTLRYSLFWDNLPFINMLYIKEIHQNKGLGSSMVIFWENEMKKLKYNSVMTSTQSNENAQHFFRKHGYIDVGGLVLHNEALEIILFKKLGLTTAST